ncbi:response regulator [Candidatus Peregrinibacteria bacterium]|nr:response regulator [Candidatus Peregrinibacteria bacterium]
MPKASKKSPGKTILIAEDDPFLSKIIRNRLAEEGFAIDTATDGDETLQKISTGHYALVTLDLIMPNKNGFEVLAELKKQKIKVPVLVFTNLAQSEDEREVMSLGAKGYYVKSDISIDDLVNTVKRYV